MWSIIDLIFDLFICNRLRDAYYEGRISIRSIIIIIIIAAMIVIVSIMLAEIE